VDPTLLNPARVVDLSVTLSEGLPGTWPGHMTFAHHNWNWFAEVEGPTGRTRSIGPYQTNFLVIDEHCGTHFDAPTHFVPPEGSGLPLVGTLGAETGDRVPPDDLMGPAVVVDVRSLSEEGKPGVSPFITDEHILAWEEEHGPVREGEDPLRIVRTGGCGPPLRPLDERAHWDPHRRPPPLYRRGSRPLRRRRDIPGPACGEGRYYRNHRTRTG
jgi:kynurenine formamidase